MAGLGRRVFAAGEVLTAGNVMGYLQDQAVMNFAGTAARGSAIGTAVAEGMVSYLADNNFVQAYDGTAWRSIGGVQVASGTAARDALLPSPIQGDKVFRTDLGFEQTYYTAAGTANPGGRASAGWYDNQRNMGLIPVLPSTVNYSGGTATANTLGVVEFSAVTSFSFNNVFSAAYNSYRLIISCSGNTLGGAMYLRTRNAGSDRSTTNHYWGGKGARESGGDITIVGNGGTGWDIARTIINNPYGTVITMDISNPYSSSSGTTANWQSWCNDGSGGFGFTASGIYSITAQSDGFTVYITSGNMTGRCFVQGYNV